MTEWNDVTMPPARAPARIDAHIHFWQPACGFDNRPVADHAAYRRDFMPTDVEAELDRSGIDAVVLVQTCPQVEETAWLLALAQRHPRIAGVTGWVDLDDARCDYAALLGHARLVGIRAQLRRIADDGFVERPAVLRNLARALDAGLGVTLLAEERHYAHVQRVLAALPPGPVTFNHLGMRFPGVDAAAWRTLLRAIAARPQTFMQLSGLPFLYAAAWREHDAGQVLDEALDLLGPSRLLFASDWPMLVRFATYGEWVAAVERFLAERSIAPADQAAIFAGNALRANPRLCLAPARVPSDPSNRPHTETRA